jgi:uncharacterized Zn finger protein
MGYWGYHWYPRYPKTSPRPVREGIKARTKGKIGGQTWWAERWISVLESFGWEWANRLHRGRSYARRGQVIGYEIAPGQIAARVQGSRPKPYSVEIRVKQLSRQGWDRVAGALSKQAVFAAKLLAGEMPRQVEEAFRKARASLFPASARELDMQCSCPDWAVPCKHIAAVYYIVGEAFDRDPFLMFHLRGRSREQLLSVLRKKRAGEAAGSAGPARDLGPREEEPGTAPLRAAPEEFWKGGEGLEEFRVSVALPAAKTPVLRRLGAIPFWAEAEEFFPFMEGIYAEVSRLAMDLAYRPASRE